MPEMRKGFRTGPKAGEVRVSNPNIVPQVPDNLTADGAGGRVGRCFLATYRPLVRSASGRQAIQQHSLLPFIDGSCRREPDFESRFPSITATCRGGNFAPRLQVGHRVAYLTVRGRYLGDSESGWRLVAVLRVLHRFESHPAAAVWYEERGEPLPSNCFVQGNLPKPLELTNGDPPKEVKKRMGVDDPIRVIRLWNATYQKRITRWPVFLVTEVEFIELNHPPQLTERQIVRVFGRIPSTLNPPAISRQQLESLVRLATGS
jgi:hypothetical protein